MCSIIGSHSRKKIRELIALNLYRGQHSWSISYYNPKTGLSGITRGMGEIPEDMIIIPEGYYCIVHMQAPTTSNKDINTVHPAQIANNYLWHNGIVKAEWVKRRKYEIEVTEYPADINSWDTYLILRQYLLTSNLDNIDGTFACLLSKENELYLFRNEISPLFIDKYNNISSTRFEGAAIIKPNIVWAFDPNKGLTDTGIAFETVENPYFGLDS